MASGGGAGVVGLAAPAALAVAEPLALRALCLLTGAALHVAPVPTMREIAAAHSTLSYHVAPYAATLLNHVINGYYAVYRGDRVLVAHRIAGVAANAAFVYIYMSHCASERVAASRRWLLLIAVLFLAVLAELHLLLPALGRAELAFSHLAVFAAITGVGLAASPLVTLREVIVQRDSSSLPVALCTMVTVQCASWTLYGWLKQDWSTFANNAVGAALGCFQLALICACPRRRATTGEVKRRLDDIGTAASGASPGVLAAPSAAAIREEP